MTGGWVGGVAGGQSAPLPETFHREIFGDKLEKNEARKKGKKWKM